VHAKGKLAQTTYKVLKKTARFSLLQITLLTGRKNQIRVHPADKGHPVVGDRKYGKDDDYRRLALHYESISFKHPATSQPMTFQTRAPNYFNELIGRIPPDETPDVLKTPCFYHTRRNTRKRPPRANSGKPPFTRPV
jgi:hypothetical protein